MILDILTFENYSQFIWPAFIFTFSVCFYFYKKTRLELQQQEKLFLNEFTQSKTLEGKSLKTKENTAEALTGASIF
jgi:hypothetical protein